MNKSIKTSALFDCHTSYLYDFFEKYEYPWQMLSDISSLCDILLENPPENFTKMSDNLLVGENITIPNTATIVGKAILGHGTQLRPGAYIRGDVITGSNCIIGNSSELKNCILLDKVQLPHYNYVGNSVLGSKVHLGAGAICSNFKGDGSNITIHGETDIPTHLRKLGAILGDGVDIGCGCVLNPGTVIGKGTRVYPFNCLRGVYGSQKLIKSNTDICDLIP